MAHINPEHKKKLILMVFIFNACIGLIMGIIVMGPSLALLGVIALIAMVLFVAFSVMKSINTKDLNVNCNSQFNSPSIFEQQLANSGNIDCSTSTRSPSISSSSSFDSFSNSSSSTFSSSSSSFGSSISSSSSTDYSTNPAYSFLPSNIHHRS